MIENTDRINQATNTAYAQISKKSRIITAILYVGALIIGALLGYIANDSLKEIFDFDEAADGINSRKLYFIC